jgi:phage terminase large subunit-like protein
MANGQKFPHVEKAHAYAQAVVSGEVAACKWTRFACQRQLDDLARSEAGEWEFCFDPAKAERICKFISNMPHIKGKWAKRDPKNPRAHLISLEPWQCFVLTIPFGWVNRETGLRRFKTVYIEVPRKNAKSTISSGVALYMLALDEEEGAECYSAATTRDQAAIVWDMAKKMSERSPEFCAHFGVDIRARNLNVIGTASKFEPLSAEGDSLDGLNIHFGCIDELHAHKTREVFDVLETGTGSRTQPLLWCITTAGSNRAGICYEQRTYLTKLLDRVAMDETYFGIIYTIDDDDDWTDPKVWAKANPNYGVSVNPEDLARKCAKALQMPSAINNFLTKHLNRWVNADTAWMDMRKWDACGDQSLSETDFKDDPCWESLDLASKIDLAARVRVYRREIEGVTHYFGFWTFYLPEAAAEDGRNSQYSGWDREGRLVLTPGEVTDYEFIKEDLRADVGRIQLRELAFDPWQATQLSTELIPEGFPMVEVRPTVQNFSEPMKELEKLVIQKRFHHNGCPAMSWMISNVVCHTDAKDNIYPRKERPENKIDGVVGLIMALGRAIVNGGEKESTAGLFDLAKLMEDRA